MIDVIIICLIILVAYIFLKLFFDSKLGWFLKLRFDGSRISLRDISRYKKDDLPLKEIRNTSSLLSANGIRVKNKELIDAYILGTDLYNVQFGLIEAKYSNLPLSFQSACIADRRGIDITATVKKKISINVGEKDK